MWSSFFDQAKHYAFLDTVPATIIAGIVTTYIFLAALLRLTQDKDEPPVIKTSIPFISPVIGMIQGNSNFYNQMRTKYPHLPIYTLRLPGTRLYIINSPDLIPLVQRQHRIFSFAPVEARAAKTFMGTSKPGLEIINRNMGGDDSFVPGFLRAVHPALSPGPELDDLNQNAIQVVLKSLDQLATKSPASVKLYEWVTHQLFFATTDAVFGPQNPLRDTVNLANWYKYEPALMTLMLDVLPNILASEGVKAREALVDSFVDYLTDKDQVDRGSGYIRRRHDFMTGQGVSLRDIARFEVGGVFALVGNTIPTCFWFLYHIFSDPQVLEDCRRELSNAVREDNDTNVVNLEYVKNSCPIFMSTYQEVFRFHGMGTSARVVLDDHTLDRYRIKKGSTILIPAKLQHTSEENWGSNVGSFNHRRFVKTPGQKRHNPVAFRGFGGGTTLCPGRHFATTEILLFAAVVTLRFEVIPKAAQWPLPTTAKSSQAAALDQPDYDIDVELKLRPANSASWSVSFPVKDHATLLTAEDISPSNMP
ncbi:putative cytochrome p450 oxidoreductase [Rosellinia necatrix]|uniref:Putative cytochrome p450 oxidoreductase n=1 Tax=Rosellinia necatrix TaxID=77044 RepID=A0A1S7UNR5_ROSNE|nr:putative cytochrome p450 oxidoreductase [Rosellinia necatrix]